MNDTASGRFAPYHLRCEYEATPLGFGDRHPRLSWWLSDPTTARGAAQIAYQILVASSDTALDGDDGDVWDSDRVESDQSVFVPYGGPALESGTRYWWKVRFWNAGGKASEWSEPSWFETGLLDAGAWSAQWIGSHHVGGRDVAQPAPHLRKAFELARAPAAARLHITALGLYEASINGRAVGKHVLTPGWTDYNKRVLVQAYDVTEHLASGENVLGAILGDGWYCGNVGPRQRQYYGDRPKLLAQLEIRYDDGSSETITSDSSWKASAGPILASDLLMGETYDARYEMPGWDAPGFDDGAWQPVAVFDAPEIELTPNIGPRVARIETVAAKSVKKLKRNTFIYDFGQNLVGWVRLRMKGQPGETAVLRHAEVLNPDGTLYLENLRRARATDHYTFGGDGEVIWEPRFTFHGFRFVELTFSSGNAWGGDHGLAEGAGATEAVEAVVLHSDMPVTGGFECSHALVNQLQSNILWGQKGNFLEVPTDCPQRDERLGWTGDIQVFIGTACFNMDVAGFMAKWLQDLDDAQQEDGAYPIVAPDILLNRGANGSAAWADAGLICPWIVYQSYGDARILERYYDSMKRFVEYLRAEAGPSHVRPKGGFGDWLSIGAYTPLDVIGTAYFARSAELMSRIAAVLGREDDAKVYRDVFENVCEAFCREFVTESGRIIGDSQTAYVLALRFNLLPEALRPAAMQHLLDDIDHGRSTDWPYPARHGQISTGFVGCKHINLALSENGRTDVAYKLLLNEDYPSWLFTVLNGATTMWERWDGWTPHKGFQNPGMNSFNHYAFGAVGEWMYKHAAGLGQAEESSGYKHLVVRPQVGGGMTHAEASLQTPYGPARSSWRTEGDRLMLDVSVPPNTRATVFVPSASTADVTESGKPLEKADGVSITRVEDRMVVCDVAGGDYQFVAMT